MSSTEKLTRAIVVDVDGTIAIRTGRDPFNWTELETDAPNMPVVELVNRIASTGVALVVVTGRELRYQERTHAWLEKILDHPFEIYCRPDGDFRSDEIVKEELYKRHIKPSFEVIAVFDDRDRVVKMWRNTLGLTCLQVASGKF